MAEEDATVEHSCREIERVEEELDEIEDELSSKGNETIPSPLLAFRL